MLVHAKKHNELQQRASPDSMWSTLGLSEVVILEKPVSE